MIYLYNNDYTTEKQLLTNVSNINKNIIKIFGKRIV